MSLEQSLKETDSWITRHISVASSKPDLTWYVGLNTIYADYHDRMKILRVEALAKYEFGEYVRKSLGATVRLRERMAVKRLFSPGPQRWVDYEYKTWVIDGVRYYRDKIGGQLIFGV